MAVVDMTGFEAQWLPAENVTAGFTGTAAHDTTIFRTGAASVRCNPASGVTGYLGWPVSGTALWIHFGLYIATLPSVTRVIVGSSGGPAVKLLTDGTLEYYGLSEGLIGTSSTALQTGQWYWIGVARGTVASAPLMQIDGSTEVSGSINASNWSGQFGAVGTEASTIDLYIDDLIVDNAGFLGPSKVDMALPISDNTRTNVTGGAGGTTNLWDAVNNTPPAGVASASETNTTNIEFPASLTESYIANLETYTTLGIVSGDTVLATRGIIRHGEDIATGTKNGTYVGTTNPTQTDNTAFTFGNDAGAHGAEVGLWTNTLGTIVTSPSVVLGTSPTIRVDRASQTRVGCVDFMAMYVAWTPVVASQVMKTSPYPQLLAH